MTNMSIGMTAFLAFVVGWLVFGATPSSQDNLYLYTTRQQFLIEPVLKAFYAKTGIKVQTIYAKTGLVERLKLEGVHGRADIILAADASIMIPLEEDNLLAPLPSDILAKVASNYRSEFWIGVTKRMRVPMVRTDKSVDITSYEDLTKPAYKGRLCMRSGKHPYNVTLVAAMLFVHGETWTEQWLMGIKNNLAFKPQGNDRAQARAIFEHKCDASIMNHYYMGKMIHSSDENEKLWAENVRLIFPNAQKGGAYGSVSAVAMSVSSHHKEQGAQFIQFLLSEEGQHLFADENYEYPVRPDVAPSTQVQSWGVVFEGEVDYVTIYKRRGDALRLIDDLAFDY